MTDKKTCGTCGLDGGWCEWTDEDMARDLPRGGECYCYIVEADVDSLGGECELHVDLRRQRERAEVAEARVTELGGALQRISMECALPASDLGYLLRVVKTCALLADKALEVAENEK